MPALLRSYRVIALDLPGHGNRIDLLPKERETALRVMAGITAPRSPKSPDFVLDGLVAAAGQEALAGPPQASPTP